MNKIGILKTVSNLQRKRKFILKKNELSANQSYLKYNNVNNLLKHVVIDNNYYIFLSFIELKHNTLQDFLLNFKSFTFEHFFYNGLLKIEIESILLKTYENN